MKYFTYHSTDDQFRYEPHEIVAIGEHVRNSGYRNSRVLQSQAPMGCSDELHIIGLPIEGSYMHSVSAWVAAVGCGVYVHPSDSHLRWGNTSIRVNCHSCAQAKQRISEEHVNLAEVNKELMECINEGWTAMDIERAT